MDNSPLAHSQLVLDHLHFGPSASVSQTPITDCMRNGYNFTLNDGPAQTDAQDWYGVSSATLQLNVWARADHLVR